MPVEIISGFIPNMLFGISLAAYTASLCQQSLKFLSKSLVWRANEIPDRCEIDDWYQC